MSKYVLTALAGLAVATIGHAQQIAFDQGSNYSVNPWVDTSNQGTGFGAWTFNHTQGSGSAGVFIGDPDDGGITGMSTESFGFFANPTGSGANAEVLRSFAAPLAVGQTFSFQWGLNWDSDAAGSNRGFNLRGAEGAQLLNINMGNSSTITINGNPMLTEFGSQAFTISFTHVTSGNLEVDIAAGRDGSETFNDTFSVASAPESFAFYFNATQEEEDRRQMYVDQLEVIPEPGTMALMGLGLLGVAALRRRLA
jgi:hypothetical protein